MDRSLGYRNRRGLRQTLSLSDLLTIHAPHVRIPENCSQVSAFLLLWESGANSMSRVCRILCIFSEDCFSRRSDLSVASAGLADNPIEEMLAFHVAIFWSVA